MHPTAVLPHRLEYGRPLRARRWLRGLILVTVLVAGVLIGGPRIRILWGQRHILYWQSRCMNYSAPPELVVYEDEPAGATILLSRPNYFREEAFIGRTPVAVYVPPCLDEFERTKSAPTFGPPTAAVLFMHGRTSKKGVRRLVLVECDPGWDPARSMPGYFSWRVERPVRPGVEAASERTPAENLQEMMDSFLGNPMHRLSSGEDIPLHIRFFAGQTDRADESHFTIGYEMAAGRGTVDCWLEPDGRQLKFEIRDGPAKR